MSTLIEIKDIYKIYRPGENEVHALDGISLTIEEGDFAAIIGYPDGRNVSLKRQRRVPYDGQ